MGLFDTFALKKPIPCPDCGTEHSEFQSKQFERMLETFVEGQPANYYGWRGLTPEEEAERQRMLAREGLKDSAFASVLGALKRSDVVISKLRDGTYPVYTYCKPCGKMVYVQVVIEGGTFTGVGKVWVEGD